MASPQPPERLIDDTAYDSGTLDAALADRGVKLIAPNRTNRTRPPNQDGRPVQRFKMRWTAERSIS